MSKILFLVFAQGYGRPDQAAGVGNKGCIGLI